MESLAFYEPTVKLVASTEYLDAAVDSWCRERGISYETDAEESADALTEFGGRLCYLSFQAELRRKHADGQNAPYIDRTVNQMGHGSISEHAYWSFVIDDVSRNMTHELVRHRVGVAYSQLSTRYVDQFSHEYFGDSGHCLGFYVPPEIRDRKQLLNGWLKVWKTVFEQYQKAFAKLVKDGFEKKRARSIARHILPGSAGTAILFTVNARELNHIFKLRGSLHADDEIRRMTLQLYDWVSSHNLFKHWEKKYDAKTKSDYLEVRSPKSPV